jgi:hypothetical protein
MAIKDIKSNLLVVKGGSIIGAAGSTVQGTTEIDTANYELGLMIAAKVTTGIAGADVTIGFAESDVQGGPYTNVTNVDKLIGDGVIADGTGITVDGANLVTRGLISNKRYVVATVTAPSGLTEGVVDIDVTQKGEVLPVA